jgi:hypothetical protein
MASADRDQSVGAQKIAAIRRFVTFGQWGEVDGMPIDHFSACHVLAMHDNLSPAARELYRQMPVPRMIDLAYDQARRQVQPRSRKG